MDAAWDGNGRQEPLESARHRTMAISPAPTTGSVLHGRCRCLVIRRTLLARLLYRYLPERVKKCHFLVVRVQPGR